MSLPSRTNPTGSVAVAGEVRAIRERAALIDQTSFAKFEIAGPGTERAMQFIAANDLGGPPGKAVYTQLCNERGGIEADVTLIHDSADHFYLITGAGFGVHDSGWVSRQLPAGVSMREVTNSIAVLNLCGPRSREILQTLSAMRTCPTRRSRSSPPGASILGMPASLPCVSATWANSATSCTCRRNSRPGCSRRLWEAGKPFGLAHAGYRAIDSARLEKGYLYWSGDISPDYNPYEAGLGFCVALEKKQFRRARGAAQGQGRGRRTEARLVHDRGLSCPCTGARRSCMRARSWHRPPAPDTGTRWASPSPSGYLPTALAGQSEVFHRGLRQELPGAARGALPLRPEDGAAPVLSTDDKGIAQARRILAELELFSGIEPAELSLTRLGGLTNLVFRIDHGPSITTCCESRARAPRNTSTVRMRPMRRAKRRGSRSARRCCTSIRDRASWCRALSIRP